MLCWIKNKWIEFGQFVCANPLTFGMFAFLSVFFLFQHAVYLGWDFSAYVINAKYLFYSGNYYEVYRAPMTSVLLGVFLFLGKFGESFFILLVSSLFFASSVKLGGVLHERYFKKFGFGKEWTLFLFYFFSLNVFVFSYGVREGTELLGLAFFQFFVYALLFKKYAGHYLAFAALTRYNFLIFAPFLLFSKDWRRVLKNIGLFLGIIFVWFLYNFIKWGNWFTSIIDSYYLNIFSRQAIAEAFNFSSLLLPINYFIPFFVLGIIFIFVKLYKKDYSSLKYDFLFLLFFVIFFVDVYTIPFKVDRYLFNFVLPVAYFSLSGVFFITGIFRKVSFRKILRILFFLAFFALLVVMCIKTIDLGNNDDVFSRAAEDIHNLGFGNCRVVSPHWVPVNYYSGNVYYLDKIGPALEDNEVILIFQNSPTFDDSFTKEDLEKYTPFIARQNYIIFGKPNLTSSNCRKSEGFDSPMVDDSCKILSSKFEQVKLDKIFFKICKVINFI